MVSILKTVLFLFLFFSSVSFACSCGGSKFEEKVNGADYIYIGKVTASKLIDENEVLSELAIVEELKAYPDSRHLLSNVNYTSCDIHVAVGYEYIVFGHFGKKPSISVCSSTQPVPYDEKELKNLVKRVKSIANKSIN